MPLLCCSVRMLISQRPAIVLLLNRQIGERKGTTNDFGSGSFYSADLSHPAGLREPRQAFVPDEEEMKPSSSLEPSGRPIARGREQQSCPHQNRTHAPFPPARSGFPPKSRFPSWSQSIISSAGVQITGQSNPKDWQNRRIRRSKARLFRCRQFQVSKKSMPCAAAAPR